MNILIADGGSTKTDWCLIRDTHIGEIIQTPGLNPYFLDKEGMMNVLDKELAPFIYFDRVDQVFFYGAGLGNPLNRQRLDEVLSETFNKAELTLETDMLGAARGLFRKESGIVAIFGTGSNSCYYNNGIIQEQYPSLGYILGDEGSGAYLGKLLIRSLLRQELPEELQTRLGQKFNTDRVHILERVYQQKQANTELASYVPFIAANIGHPFLQDLVSRSFTDFFEHHPVTNNNQKTEEWRVTGSVAHVFNEQLKSSSEKYSINISLIEKSPLQGLIKYHTPEV